jgi:Tfp pilus assembly protein PilN
MAEINLLPSEEKISDSLNALQKKLTIVSVLVLAAVAVFTIVTLVMFTAAKSQETKLNADIVKAGDEVASHKATEELLTVVSKKAVSANKVISSRLNYTEIITKTAELMPVGVFFSDLKISGTKLTTSATAKTSADVANLVSSFVTSTEGKKLFANISIDSLTTNADNNYIFSVSMQVNDTKTQEASKGAGAQ